MKKITAAAKRHPLIFLCLFSLPLITGYIASSAVWEDTQHNIVTSLNTGWGDLLFHIRAAIFFAEQGTWPRESFFLSGQPVGYAYAADLISGWLWKLGLSITNAFKLPTIFFAAVITLLIEWLAWKLTNSLRAALLSTLLFITFGSLGGWPTINYLASPPGTSWQLALRQMPHGVTAWHEAGYFILNPFIMMLHQRAYLVGFPLFLLFIYFTWQYFQRPAADLLAPFVLTGLLLAFTHPLTWVSSLLILPLWLFWLIALRVKNFTPRQFLAIIASFSAIVIGGYLIIKTLQPNANPSVIQWRPGWLASNFSSWLLLWLKNAGLYILLAPLSVRFLVHRHRPLATLLLAGFTPFIAANLFQFAPWAWDNTKIFTPAWLILSLGVGATLSSLWQQYKGAIPRATLLSIVLLLTFSGTIEIIRVLTYRSSPEILIRQPDQQLGQTIRQTIKPTDTILTAPLADHPVFLLSGRPSLIAYEGWLWSQGWQGKYEQRVTDAQKIYSGAPSAPALIRQHNIAYVAIGPPEIRAGANKNWFDNRYPLTLSMNDYNLYQVKSESESKTKTDK